jgi:hypothetical protein
MLRVNPYYLLTVVTIACGSIPKGYDEGGFSAAVSLPSFQDDFDLTTSHWTGNAAGRASRLANITSFGVLGAAFGALLALAVADKLGRLRSWQAFVVCWMTGNLMQTFSSGIYGFMLFARIWGGLGAGGLTVIAPLYLAEVAPARSRGMVVSVYMVVLLTFLSLGKGFEHACCAFRRIGDWADTEGLAAFVPRLLCQLWRQQRSAGDASAVPDGHSLTTDSHRACLGCLLVLIGYAALVGLGRQD